MKTISLPNSKKSLGPTRTLIRPWQNTGLVLLVRCCKSSFSGVIYNNVIHNWKFLRHVEDAFLESLQKIVFRAQVCLVPTTVTCRRPQQLMCLWVFFIQEYCCCFCRQCPYIRHFEKCDKCLPLLYEYHCIVIIQFDKSCKGIVLACNQAKTTRNT